eukprot:scaffold421207_cov56-Attheya_sp.AAC.1
MASSSGPVTSFHLRIELECDCSSCCELSEAAAAAKNSSCNTASALTSCFAQTKYGNTNDVGTCSTTHQPPVIASARSIQMCQDRPHDEGLPVNLLGICVPHSIIEAARTYDRKQESGRDEHHGAISSYKSGHDTERGLLVSLDSRRVEEDILLQIHASLTKLRLQGIVSIRDSVASRHLSGALANLVLLEIPRGEGGLNLLTQIMMDINGEGMAAAPYAVIKCLLVSKICVVGRQPPTKSGTSTTLSSFDGCCSKMPLCPPCLHRIDPQRLGLPKPKNHHLCSKFCLMPSTASGIMAVAGMETAGVAAAPSMTTCQNQLFLTPWPSPNYCSACHAISQNWETNRRSIDLEQEFRLSLTLGREERTLLASNNTDDTQLVMPVAGPSESSDNVASRTSTITTATTTTQSRAKKDGLFCYKCGMTETLWVCLSCGVVGCGRYSHGHAKEHYHESAHAFSLELVSLRIWEYVAGEFVQRGDLLSCPSMRRAGRSSPLTTPSGPPPSLPFRNSESAVSIVEKPNDGPFKHGIIPGDMGDYYGVYSDAAKSPKKATMIGEEYEALLQSALEDQAQHYEGEISRLHATLTAEEVDMEEMTQEERMEIAALKSDISSLREETENLAVQLLKAHDHEAGYRSTYQHLLREQAVAKGLLEKIQTEAAGEHERGTSQVEELEQQISDLTANLRMRQQIAQDNELNNAQIFGTAEASTKSSSKRGGKKSRRSRK